MWILVGVFKISWPTTEKNCSDEHRSSGAGYQCGVLHKYFKTFRQAVEFASRKMRNVLLTGIRNNNFSILSQINTFKPILLRPSHPHIQPTTSLRFKSGTSSKRWVTRQKDDIHSKQSKSEGYRSRAAYKLIEIDNKFRFFGKKSKNIVDLGFAPGAWTQVALARSKSKNVRPNILGVDLLECSPPEGASFLHGDIFSKKTHSEIINYFTLKQHEQNENAEKPLDLVLSDMMVNTSGMKDNDHFASMDLCDGVLILACRLLRKNGNLVMKFYTGKEDQLLQRKLEKVFSRVQKMKPEACRAELREMYFIGLKKRLDNTSIEEVFDREL